MAKTCAVIVDGKVENIIVAANGMTELHGNPLVIVAEDDVVNIGDTYDENIGFPKKPAPEENILNPGEAPVQVGES